MKIQIKRMIESQWISFDNGSYDLYMSKNNIYLAYHNKKSIGYSNWIYNEVDKSFIKISKKSHNKVFIK